MAEVKVVVKKDRRGKYYLEVQTPPKLLTILESFQELVEALARCFHERRDEDEGQC